MMSVTVDSKPLPAEQLGLRTIGQVLSHLQKDNRLVVHVLIDGREPDLNRMGVVKQSPLNGHTIYIETAEPRRMALDVLDEVENQLDEADRLKSEAADLLRKDQKVKAMERLSGCFTTWQHAQESVLKTAQLLRIDLALVLVDGKPLPELLETFTEQLRNIRTALENRDFVSLTDILTYETQETSAKWRAAILSMRAAIQSN
jgi:hypothetical protein